MASVPRKRGKPKRMEAAPHNKKPPVGSGGFLFDSRQPAEIILSAINLRPDGYDGRTSQQILGALLVGQHVRGFAVGVEGFRAFPDLIEKERAVFGAVLMEIVPDTAFFSPHVRDVLHHFRFKLRFHAFLRRQLGGHKTRVHTMLLFRLSFARKAPLPQSGKLWGTSALKKSDSIKVTTSKSFRTSFSPKPPLLPLYTSPMPHPLNRDSINAKVLGGEGWGLGRGEAPF